MKMTKYKNISIKSSSDYMEDFLPTLSNFCNKTPLNIEINYVKDLNKVFLKYKSRNEDEKILEIDIDINKPKKEVIKDIKLKLQRDYPFIYEKVLVVPTVEDLENLTSQGVSLSDALQESSYQMVKKFQVIRVHHKFNEIDVVDLKSNLIYKYKSKIPIVPLLQMIKNKEPNVMDNLNVLYQIDSQKKEK